MSGMLSLDSLNEAMDRLFPKKPSKLVGLDYVALEARILVSTNMVEKVPYPRSPARAKRRLAQKGIQPHMSWRPRKDAFKLPDGSLMMHPVMAAELRQKIHLDHAKTFRPGSPFGELSNF